ncbi:MAG TPA: POTRA domain-containing protein [Stellaceae bacterium]|nr:POTRA domain-containing protein [Stellaceae bacterium]
MAHAQAPPAALPPSVEPGRLQQQFQPGETAPNAAPQIDIPQMPGNAVPEGADNVHLALASITIDGATVYDAATLSAMTAAYIGKPIVLGDLFQLADRITERYRSDGYVLSRAVVPAQHITNAARIVVVEGFVSGVHVDGYDTKRIEAYGRRIKASRPLRAAILERYMLLINDLPGVSARAVLSPSADVAGGATLTIVSRHAAADGNVSVDNRGTRYIGPVQLYSGAGANIPGDQSGIPLADGRVSFRAITTPSIRELRYGEFSITEPIGTDGLRLVLFGSQSWSNPGYKLSPAFTGLANGTDSYGSTYMATLSYPVIRSRDENLELRAAASALDSQSVTNGDPALPPSSDDHLRVVQLGMTYDRADRWNGVNLLTLQESDGLPILGASAFDHATPTRLFERSDFRKVLGEASRQQDLSAFAAGWGALAAIAAQRSLGGALPSSQQFGVGGPIYGRAYDPSDIIGDNGLAGRTELQYTRAAPGYGLDSVQPYGFFDTAHVYHNVASAGPQHLSSAGGGVRATVEERFSADLQIAKPLTRDLSIELDQPNARPWRFFFALSAQF